MNSVGIYRYKMASYSLVVGIFMAVTLFSAKPAHAATIGELEYLLAQLQAQLATILENRLTPSQKCVELDRPLRLFTNDALTNGQVSKLQQFLRSGGYYTYPTLTGYYGNITADAVKSWQSANEYRFYSDYIPGDVDGATREAMAVGCKPVAVANAKVVSSPTEPIVLKDIVTGHEMLQLEVSARALTEDTELSNMTVNLTLPFVKAGSYEDMISQIILVSTESQFSVRATSIMDNGRIVSLLDENHDDITATFEIPASEQHNFKVEAGEGVLFKIIVDFKPIDVVGAFGVSKDESVGYIRAELAEILNEKGAVIPISISPFGNQYGPHRMISSAY